MTSRSVSTAASTSACLTRRILRRRVAAAHGTGRTAPPRRAAAGRCRAPRRAGRRTSPARPRRSRRRPRTWAPGISGALLQSIVFICAVEVRQRIGHDLVDHRLDRRPVLRRVVHEDARDDVGELGRAADDCGDAGGHVTVPVRPDEQVEAGLGAVGLADLRELIGARVVERVDPEPVAEVRHLDDHRLLVEREEAEPVDHVLVRAGDEGLAGVDVVAAAWRAGRAARRAERRSAARARAPG